MFFFSSVIFIRRLKNLDIKKFLLGVAFIKFLIFIVLGTLHFVLPFDSISPILSEYRELYAFYIVNIDKWSSVKIFLFLMPLSHLAFSCEAGYCLAVGIGVYNVKIFTLAQEFESLVRYTSSSHFNFQSQMRCLGFILPNPELPLSARLLSVEKFSEHYFQKRVKDYNDMLSRIRRSDWVLIYNENYSKQFSKFKQIPLLLNNIDLGMKNALVGNGISGFNLLKDFDQGSPYLNKVSQDQWSAYQRGVAYSKILLNEEAMTWRLAFDDASYNAISEADTNSEQCFQLVRESEVVLPYLKLYDYIGVDRPQTKCDGDFIITDARGVEKTCEIKSLALSKDAPKILPSSEKGYDYLTKQLQLRFLAIDAYFAKHNVLKGIALVQLNCLSSDTNLINFKVGAKGGGLDKTHIHAIVSYHPEKE